MEYKAEIEAVGLTYTGIYNGVVQAVGDPDLLGLVVAAHDRSGTSTEVTTLKTRLGAESDEWAAYQDARRRPVSDQRSRRYAQETDRMIFKTLEQAVTIVVGEDKALSIDPTGLTEWQAAKTLIRTELPHWDEQ